MCTSIAQLTLGRKRLLKLDERAAARYVATYVVTETGPAVGRARAIYALERGRVFRVHDTQTKTALSCPLRSSVASPLPQAAAANAQRCFWRH